MGFSSFRKGRIARVLLAAGLAVVLAAGGAPDSAMGFVSASGGKASVSPGPLEAAIVELKKERLFEVLFRLYPEAEAEFRREYAGVGEDEHVEALVKRSRPYQRALVIAYVARHLPHAPDTVIFRFLTYKRDVLRLLERYPAYCDYFFSGDPFVNPAEVLGNPPADEAALFADVLESVRANPSPPKGPLSRKKAQSLIQAAARARGLELEPPGFLAGIKAGTPEKECRQATLYMEAFVGLGEKDAASVYRALNLPEETAAEETGETKQGAEEFGPVPAEDVPGLVFTMIEQLRKKPFYDGLFKLHPGAEEETRAAASAYFASYPREPIPEWWPNLYHRLVSKYARRSVFVADRSETIGYLRQMLDVLAASENQPEACVSYYLGAPLPASLLHVPGLSMLDAEAKEKVLKSAHDNPSPPPDPADPEKAMAKLKSVSRVIGVSQDGLKYLKDITSHDPATACAAAANYLRGILALKRKDAVDAFKSLGFTGTGEVAVQADETPVAAGPGQGITDPDMIDSMVETMIGALKEQRIQQALFRAFPEAETRMRAEFEDIIKAGPYHLIAPNMAEAYQRITLEWFDRHKAHASDEVHYRSLWNQLNILTALEDRPTDCVAFFMGMPDRENLQLDEKLMALEEELFAEILESAGTNPSPPPDPVDEEKVTNMLLASYETNGYDAAGLALLEDIGTRDPAAACRAARTYMRAIVAMGERDAVYVHKSIGLLEPRQ